MAKGKSTAAKKRAKTNVASGSSTQPAPPTPTSRPSNNGTANGQGDGTDSDDDEIPDLVDDDDVNMEPPKEENEEEKRARAEKTKEAGNVAFKAKKYTEAVDKYSIAVDLNPTEPTYLNNRAAALMALKRFRPALADCQAAATLQSSSPSSKTLVRLAKCQLSLGQYAAALSTLRSTLEAEPGAPAAVDLQKKIKVLDGHLAAFEKARRKKEWAMARLSLDQAVRAQEGEGGEIPVAWRLWRVEVELARGGWDAASAAANDALRMEPNSVDVLVARARIMFLTGKLTQALQHVMEALRLDPGSESAQQLRKRIKDVERLKEEGNTAFKTGKLDDAVRLYSETLDRIGSADEDGKGGQIRATLLSNRATTYLKLKDHDNSLADIDASLALHSSSFKALRTRARIYLHQEKYDEALGDFRSALEQAEFDDATADVKALRIEIKKAEVELKRSKTKDYYKILGVSREATDAELKKAYRRESLVHHPDKGGDEEKFKLVAESWAVLSDPQRRQRYDLGEEDGQSSGMGGGMDGMDLSELFAQFHGGGGMHGGHGHPGMGGGFGGGFPGGRPGGRSSFRSGGPAGFGF